MRQQIIKKLSNLPKVTQLVSGAARTLKQALLFTLHYLFPKEAVWCPQSCRNEQEG